MYSKHFYKLYSSTNNKQKAYLEISSKKVEFYFYLSLTIIFETNKRKENNFIVSNKLAVFRKIGVYSNEK